MITDMGAMVDFLTTSIANEVDIAIVGVSGGADSTLVAILCQQALYSKNVQCVTMPYTYIEASEKSADKVKVLCHKLEVNLKVLPIDAFVDRMNRRIFSVFGHSITNLTKANIMARTRMTYLYGVANMLSDIWDNKKVRVVGTSNLSEGFMGYCTKFGDNAADLMPIADLFKSEVYQMLDHFVEQGVITESMVNRVPSADLWDGQTDEDEMGYTYDEIETGFKDLTDAVNSMSPSGKSVDMAKTSVDNGHKSVPPKQFKGTRKFCDWDYEKE